MLRAIAEAGDEATTSEIRDVTGLSNSQVAYRRDKLRDRDLIEVETGEPTGGRTPPKAHSLTEAARSYVDAGLFEVYDPPVTGDVNQLSTQVNHLRDRVDEIDETVERLGERIEKVEADVTARVGTTYDVRKATDGATLAEGVGLLRSNLEDVREELGELEDRKRDKFFG